MAAILLYHRVTLTNSDPWALNVPPRNFADHLAVLSTGYRVYSLRELVVRADRGEAASSDIAITFDDGYADNVNTALPLLQRHGFPATFFVPSGAVDSRQEFWWDELDAILLQPRDLPDTLDITIGGAPFTWQLGSAARAWTNVAPRWLAWEEAPSPRHALYYELWARIQRLSPQDGASVLRQLQRWAHVPAELRETHRTVTSTELLRLAAAPLAEVGSHTISHPRLSDAAASVQRHEIAESKRLLEQAIGRPISTFSYPFGKPTDYTTETIALVRGARYEAACCNAGGTLAARLDPFQLPRLFVMDLDGDAFGRWLSKLTGNTAPPRVRATESLEQDNTIVSRSSTRATARHTVRCSVIVPSYGSEHTIRACLSALRDQDAPFTYEVIVVDSSADRTSEIVSREFPDATLIQLTKRAGPETARNTGAERANGEILAFIDSDCIAKPDWLRRLVSRVDEGYEAIGGATENGNPDTLVSWAGYICEFREFLPAGTLRPMAYLSPNTAAYPRHVFARLGGFPAGFYPMEDQIFHAPLVRENARIALDPQIAVAHMHRTELAQFLQHQYRLGLANARVARLLHRRESWFVERPRLTQFALPFLVGYRFLRTTLPCLSLEDWLVVRRPTLAWLCWRGTWSWGRGFLAGARSGSGPMATETWQHTSTTSS